jgi:putative transposase
MATKLEFLKSGLESCLGKEMIRNLAKEVNWQKRHRKIDPYQFVCSLVMSFGSEQTRSLSGLYRSFILATGLELSRSSYYDRFTCEFVCLMKEILNHSINQWSENIRPLKGMLSGFTDLIAADATVLKLHDMLKNVFPSNGRRNQKAIAKIHLTTSLLSDSPAFVVITSERVNESKSFVVNEFVSGKLLVFDLGYFKYDTFNKIDKYGGFFISRVTKSANPKVSKDNLNNNSEKFEGKKLKEILEVETAEILDLCVTIDYSYNENRDYSYKRREKKLHNIVKTPSYVKIVKPFRMVSLKNPDNGKYHTYITNIPPARLSASDIWRIYRGRWEVEMIFKELKSVYRMDEFHTKNTDIVLSLIYVSILQLILSRRLLHNLKCLGDINSSRVTRYRFSILMSYLMQILLVTSFSKNQKEVEEKVLKFLLHEIESPNKKRTHNIYGLQC